MSTTAESIIPTTNQGRRMWVPTEAEKKEVAEINAFLEREGLTAHDLAEHAVNAKTGQRRDARNWKHKIGKLVYGSPDASAILKDYKLAAQALARVVETRKAGGLKFEPTRAYTALLEAVKEAEGAQGIGSAERCVIAAGPTGNGKTWACRQVKAVRGTGELVHGNRLWRLYFGEVLRDIARALGLRVTIPATKRRAERLMREADVKAAIFDRLQTVRTTLVFEELSEGTLSAGLLELWVELLNKTMATIVLAINPDGLRALRTVGLTRADLRAGRTMSDTSKQLLRRGVVVPFTEVEPAAVLGMLEQRLAGADEGTLLEVAGLLAEAGQADGGYSLVRNAVVALAAHGPAALSVEAAEKLVAKYKGRFAEELCTGRTLTVHRGRRAA